MEWEEEGGREEERRLIHGCIQLYFLFYRLGRRFTHSERIYLTV